MEVKNAPYMVSTESVRTAMRQAALKFGVVIDKVEFKVQQVTTLIKNQKTKSVQKVSELTQRDLTNPDLLISQTYDIILKEKGGRKSLFPDILFANNSSHTVAYIVITRNQNLKLSSFSQEDFLNHLEEFLLLYNCLIRVSNDNVLKKEIAKMYDNYKVEESISEEIKIQVIDFPSPTDPIPDSLDLLYKKGNKKLDDTQSGKNKIALASSKQDSIIIKYTKIVEGVIGRKFDGKIISVGRIKPRHAPDFTIEMKTIKKEEDNYSIDYIAKETGFVFFENKFLRIDNQTEMNSANIRNQDKLVTALDDGVSINIKSKDKLSDAVGANIKVRSDKVNINGNVGPSATVEGNFVKIGGQTHSKSKIIAKRGHIFVHKGDLQGEDIIVDRLEGGTIFAKNVQVKIARGGRIEGETVIIGTLESNVEITASIKIQIRNITGESNIFTLKPIGSLDQSGEEVSIEGLHYEKDILEDKIKKQKKALKEKEFLIKFNEKSLGIQRDDKIDKVRYNISFSTSMNNKLKSYVKLKEDTDALKNDLKKYQKQEDEITLQIKILSEGAENAFMEVNTVWTGGNSVHIHNDYKVYNFYPVKGKIKSPISFETLKKEKLI